MKKKNRFDLKEEYKKSWEFIKESRKFIYAILIIFFAFSLIGFFLPVPEYIEEQLMEFLKNLIEQTKDMSAFQLVRFIFLNNLQSSFIGIAFGVIAGIIPIILTLVNGYLLGFVSSLAVSEGGFFVLLRLFPHGIFELPAIFISLAMGLKLGSLIFKKHEINKFSYCLINIVRVFFLIIVPLLIIAAIIEGVFIAIP